MGERKGELLDPEEAVRELEEVAKGDLEIVEDVVLDQQARQLVNGKPVSSRQSPNRERAIPMYHRNEANI